MKDFVFPLLNWFYQNKRVLPWRIDKNPYHVWISEIMLQQTRIEAVISYYNRFIQEFPTIEDLANCPLDRLLKLWEGLGYYNRAKNLQKAAKIIISDYNGIFPSSYSDIIKLPGIGEYTASAISSVCFSLKEATVDGNVLRVYMRLHNCYDNVDDLKVKKRVRNELMEIMPEDAGSFNEAMMELGETVCIPNGIPKCEICPIKDYCHAYSQKSFLSLPVKLPKKEKLKENYTVLLFIYKDLIAISKRDKQGLLSGMWQFPNISGNLSRNDIKEWLDKQEFMYSDVIPSISYQHIFTHKIWNISSYIIFLKSNCPPYEFSWVTFDELENDYAMPTVFKRLQTEIEIKFNR